MKYLNMILWLIGSVLYGQNHNVALSDDIAYKDVYEVEGLVYKKSDSSAVNARVIKYKKERPNKYIIVNNGKPSISGWVSISNKKSSRIATGINNVIDAGLDVANVTHSISSQGDTENPQNGIDRIYQYRENTNTTTVKHEPYSNSGLSPLIKEPNMSESKKINLDKEREPIVAIENGTKIDYYSNEKIKSKIEYLNGEKDGIALNYYFNGQLENRGSYTKGKRSGVFENYYDSGKLEGIVNFIDGKEDGECKFYDEKGKLFISGLFKNGVYNGMWEYYNEEGDLIKHEIYNEGELISKKEY